VATVLPPDGLNLRAGPGTSHPRLALLPSGARIALTGPATGDGWYPAMHQAKRGWVRGEFLDIPGDGGQAPRKATVNARDGLILRDEPHAAAKQLLLMPGNAAITVGRLTTSDGWVLVAFNGQTGWASTQFLSIEGAPPSPSEAARPGPGATGSVRAVITYYHPSLEGGPMFCGGRYRGEDATIAAATGWPCGTKLRVCRGSACVVVTVQDTGALPSNHVDLSIAAFRQLGTLAEAKLEGTVEVVRE
jgi:uncharacterized protein YraI